MKTPLLKLYPRKAVDAFAEDLENFAARLSGFRSSKISRRVFPDSVRMNGPKKQLHPNPRTGSSMMRL